MTSAYETTTECEQQKATSPRDIAKIRHNSEGPSKPDPVADMEETSSSSRASPATGDSSFEESTLSSVEVSVPPAESFDGDLGMFGKEEEDKDEGCVGVSAASVNDTWRMSRSKNEVSSVCEGNERDSAASESASTCGVREERVKDQVKDQENRSVLEVHVRDHATCDSSIHGGEEEFRDSAVEDVRACCENVAEICLGMEEQRDELEREIVGQQDGDSFYDAVRAGNAKRVATLIANGCVQNLDEPDWNVSGDPPLLMAATNHCLPVLRYILLESSKTTFLCITFSAITSICSFSSHESSYYLLKVDCFLL